MTTRKEQIYLGIHEGEEIYLSKHSWDCGWYWCFGYVGNRNRHFHFDTFLKYPEEANKLFTECNFTDSSWWIIRDLFIQAYALKKVAEIYRYGGHQTTRIGITDILNSEEKARQANADLELVLNTLWHFMTTNNLGK